MGEVTAKHTSSKDQGETGLRDCLNPLQLCPKVPEVPEHRMAMPVSADINAQRALGSRKYALTLSTAGIPWHQQESPVAKQARATVTLFREQGGVSGEGNQSLGGSVNAQNVKTHILLPHVSGHQALAGTGRLCAPEVVLCKKMIPGCSNQNWKEIGYCHGSLPQHNWSCTNSLSGF